MADNRRVLRSRRAAYALYQKRLAQWAEIVSLVKQLENLIHTAERDGVIDRQWQFTLCAHTDAMIADLIHVVPSEGHL